MTASPLITLTPIDADLRVELARRDAEARALLKERDALQRRVAQLEARAARLTRMVARFTRLCNLVKHALAHLLSEDQLYRFCAVTGWDLNALTDARDWYDVTTDEVLSDLHTGRIGLEAAVYLLDTDADTVRGMLTAWQHENGGEG